MPSPAAPYYVYEWIRPDLNVVFYVGKGKGKRAWCFKRNGAHVQNVVDKLSRIGLAPEVRILARFVSEHNAFEYEIERIAFWEPLGELSNKTKGGDGPTGYKWTDLQKNKLSEVAKIVQNRPDVSLKKSHTRKNFLVTSKGLAWRERQSMEKIKFCSTPEGLEWSKAHSDAVVSFYQTKKGLTLAKEQSERAKIQCKGAGNPNSKITEELAQQILDFKGTRSEAAEHFGVTYNIASGIKSGRKWGHLKPSGEA